MIGGLFASEAAEPSAVIILKKIDMDRIEIVNKYCGGGTLPKVITESPDHEYLILGWKFLSTDSLARLHNGST